MLKARIISFLLVGLGWLTSGYLLLPHLSPGSGVPGCSGCEVLAASASSWQMGLPVAGWGLGYFSLLALLLVWWESLGRRLALVVSGLGSGASLVLLAHLLTGSVVWCQICVVTHAVNLSLLLSLWLPSRSSSGPGAASRLFAGNSGLAVLAGVVLLGAGLEATLYQAEVEPADALASFEAEPMQELVRPEVSAPVDGEPVAEISVFSCFQCPGCQSFALVTESLRERFGDRLTIDFHNFPLSTACNPALANDMHPQSCQAAWAAEAARQQGQFWPFHDGLFHSDLTATEPTLQAIARSLGLDTDQWNADRNSPIVRQRVSQDIQRGMELRIDVTPSVFLNGRRVRELTLPVLSALIEHELTVN